MEDITEFLKTGYIKNVSLGYNIDLIEDTYFNEKQVEKNSIVFRNYINNEKDIRFILSNKKIIGISIMFWNNESYLINKKIVDSKINTNDFLLILDELSIKWKIDNVLSKSKILCIKMESNVYAFFDLDIYELLKIAIG